MKLSRRGVRAYIVILFVCIVGRWYHHLLIQKHIRFIEFDEKV